MSQDMAVVDVHAFENTVACGHSNALCGGTICNSGGLESADDGRLKTDHTLQSVVDRTPHSSEHQRPCFVLLQLLGMWRPNESRFEVVWPVYRAFVYLLLFASLVAIMGLDFVHYGFEESRIHLAEIMNSVPTCLNLLCPFLFTQVYFKYGQFDELVSSVDTISSIFQKRLQKTAYFYTAISATLWILAATFFVFHWAPFFSFWWHYAVYIPVIVYTTGWWAIWLSIYGFVCQVHRLQIDDVVDSISSEDCNAIAIVYKHQQLQNSLERTQKDFNFILSFAFINHALDIIVFSFAYFDAAFGSRYKSWQYIGGALFDLVSIFIKLWPPALLASDVHSMVTKAAKRCQMHVTPETTNLPLENMQLFEHIAYCEQDMGLKILGICITIELVGKILMTLITAGVSFVAFVVPRLK